MRHTVAFKRIVPTQDYKLLGNTLLATPEINAALHGLRSADGATLARGVAGLYRARGYYTVEAVADVTDRPIGAKP